MTAIEQSQNEFMAVAEHVQNIRCPNADYEPCYHPACGCHCAPIKAEAFPAWPVIDFAGDEPDALGNQISRHWTQEQHADHLEATREPRSPSHFRPLLKWMMVSALAVVLAGIFVVRL